MSNILIKSASIQVTCVDKMSRLRQVIHPGITSTFPCEAKSCAFRRFQTRVLPNTHNHPNRVGLDHALDVVMEKLRIHDGNIVRTQ